MSVTVYRLTDNFRIRKASNELASQNVAFSDQTDPYLYDVGGSMDPTRMLQDSNDADLNNFFSRPIKIAEYEWSTTLPTIAQDFDPWSLYFENPRVANRLCNYNLLRCKLYLKFIINGNGFLYGRSLVSYLPADAYDDLSSNAALIKQDLVQASQQPHVFLDPTTSTGGDMCLPFFYHENYINIPDGDWDRMGRVYIRTLSDLKHANGAADQVTISCFAWAEEVECSVLTIVEPTTLTPQMGKKDTGKEVEEANTTGMVSGPASLVAKAAGMLKCVPYIGPFAMATETAANMVGGVAKVFGYSRPTLTRAADPYRPTPTTSLAMTNVPDNAQKLTVDEFQELSIDPKIAGIGSADALSIKSIASRESYLTSFSWTVGTAPESLLWNARVDPCTWAQSAGSPDAYHFPACAMAALPFKYWTGTMKFRFQIVCSNFHKGRLKFVYDPNALWNGATVSTEYNTNYLRIVDISEEQDLTIEVGNGQSMTLLEHHLPGVDAVTQMYSTSPFTSREEGNGVLAVMVVNELTVPNSTINNDITVNVFVSMGDDFEVFVPDDHFQKFVFKPQMGEIVPDAQATTEPSKPVQEETMNLGPSEQDTSLINKVFTGESIASFRTLLKRYNMWTTFGNNNGGQQFTKIELAAYPYLRGNVSGAINQQASLATYNFCNTILLHWVVNAFSGWRGSIRYKALSRGGWADRTSMYVSRGAYKSAPYGYNQYGFSSPTNQDRAAAEALAVGYVPSGTTGSAYTHAMVNPTIEWEVPYYSRYRFSPGKEENHTTSTPLWNNSHVINTYLHDSSVRLDMAVAVGEDFQTYFFTGLPRMYYEASPPAAV